MSWIKLLKWLRRGSPSQKAGSRINESKSYLAGSMVLLDLGGTLLDDMRYDPLDHEKDFLALQNDWILVGEDFYTAIDTFQVSEGMTNTTNEKPEVLIHE